MSIEVMKLALEALESNQPVNYCENAYGERSPIFLSNPLRFEINAKAIAALRQAIKDEEESFRPDYDTNAVLLERIRELEQAEKQEPVAWLCCPPGKCAYRQIHKTENCPRENLPADTAPMSTKHEKIDTKSERVDGVDIEPVAWIYKDGTTTSDPDRADGTWTPLYTAPISTKQENIDTKTEHVDSVNIEPVINAYYVYRVALEGIGTHDYDFKTHTNIYRGEAPSEEFVTLYAAPPKREWKSLTDNEIIFIENSTPSRSYNDHARAIEAKLKELNK